MNLAKAARDPWVRAQLALLLVLGAVGPAVPRIPSIASLGGPLARTDSSMVRVIGLAVGVLGLAFTAWGAKALGAALTPEPEPLPGATLARLGPYRLVRHPIYTGVIAAAAGWTLAWSNWPLALLVAVILSGFFEAKARVEERWLGARFPDYGDYARTVRWRVVWPDRRPPPRLP